jgi:Tfp pilus assembly protein PilO
MTPTDSTERRSNWKSTVLERLHDPLQFRVCIIVGIVLLGFAGVYQPLSDKIATVTQQVQREGKLLALGEEIERLQSQYRSFEDRIPVQSDTKDWVQYVLEGIRRLPLKMTKFDCRPSKQIGPYQVIVLQIELEGSFFAIDKFLRWLETDRRLFRADDIRMAAAQGNSDNMVMQVTVLGLAG